MPPAACTPSLPRRTPYPVRAGQRRLSWWNICRRPRSSFSARARPRRATRNLDMADWCVTRAVEEARHEPPAGGKPTGQAAAKPN